VTDVSDILSKLSAAQTQLISPGSPFEIQEIELQENVTLRHYPNAPTHLREALNAGRKHGESIFITYGDEVITFNEFFDQVDRLSHYLIQECRIQPADRIAIAMRNYPEWMIAFTAAVSIGAIVVPLNSWGKKYELEYSLRDSSSKLLFCDEERFNQLDESLEDLPLKAILVRATQRTENPKVVDYSTTQKSLGNLSEVTIEPFDDVLIMYTSGTTGKPKGAVSTNFALTQALYNFEMHAAMSAMANQDLIAKMMENGFPPSTLLAVPLFHVSGCHSVFMLNLRGGRKISMMYKWDPEVALNIIERERITTFTGAPIMSIHLLSHPNWKDTDTSSLFALGVGGAACPSGLAKLVYEKIDNVYAGTGYGLTETNATCSNFTGEAFRLRPDASGTVSPVVDIKTVDDEGKTLPAGETGEICIRSPTNARAYWNLTKESEETFQDFWVSTGDLGFVDQEELVNIVGRIKDVIIRGGENIYPAEIEAVLSNYPGVEEASVYGLQDNVWGEIVGATVFGINLNEEAIKNYVASQLAAFKVPKHIFISDTPLERNAAGKLLAKKIKEKSKYYQNDASN